MLTNDPVWDSVRHVDRGAIHKQAVQADCIRKLDDGPRYVPPTAHWAHWKDEDAIRYHGIASIAQLIDRFAQRSAEPWDGTYQHLWMFEEN